MGLPTLTVKDDLAAQWRMILEQNALRVRLDQGEIERQMLIRKKYSPAAAGRKSSSVSKWVKTPWIVSNEAAEIAILETTIQDQSEGNVFLVFLFPRTRAERWLFDLVQRLLLASGANKGGRSL
jgi:hypothetical protein